MIRARKIVTVTAGDHCFHLVIVGETVSVVPCTATRESRRYRAYATHATPSALMAWPALSCTL
jgi:hypothetical protein